MKPNLINNHNNAERTYSEYQLCPKPGVNSESDSLHGNKYSYGGYAEGPDRYLETDDEDLQNLAYEEMNRSHQLIKNKYLSVSDGEEDHYRKDDVEEKKGPMYDDSYTEEQYTIGPVEGMYFRYVQTAFAFYKEHGRLTGFGVVKKSTKKVVGQLKYVTFGCDKCRKTMARNQSKRVHYKAWVNYQVMNDGSYIVTKVILEHNHEFEPALSHFFPSHRELSKTVKRSLVAHDITGLRPSKSIRLLEVEAGGPKRMRFTPKDCRNYIL
ncbi:hypothetical protein FXO38_05186 [Capsicum annuum]|nr:hypothetical protein FXO37_11120 [Capsicum annuum]KAF3674519.1 hypothetical protein FXO38_05186 [Capsicum annuum]